jgi:methionine-rich copper-binding protein CopC
MSVRRLAAALLLAGVAVVGTATPAPALGLGSGLAHAELIASTPAEGAALPAPPQEVQLTFNEPVTPAATPVQITGPGGAAWTAGAPAVAGAVVTVPVQPAAGPPGVHTLLYEVSSRDGDPVTGTVRFTLTAAVPVPTTTTTTPAAPTTTTTAAPDTTTSEVPSATDDSGTGGIPAWVWLAGIAVVLVAGLLVVLRLVRARRS